MARKRQSGSGAIECAGPRRYYYRPRLADGSRPRFRLAATTRAAAEAEASRIYGWIGTARDGSVEDQLRALVSLGDWAREELRRLDRAGRGVGMSSVWETYARQASAAPATLALYRRAWDSWSAFAAARGLPDAAAAGAAEVQAYMAGNPPARAAKYLATIWRGAGLDPGVWASEARAATAAESAQSRQYRRISPAEARAVVAALRSDPSPWATMAADMVVVGWHTALRLADTARLSGADWDEDAQCLRIVPSKTARKKPHPLAIPLADEARSIVITRGRGGGALFPGALVRAAAGNEIARREISDALARGFAKVRQGEQDRASFHSLRATFISLMDEAGVPAAITDSITGHAPQTMHGHYSQPDLAAVRRAVARAIPSLSGKSAKISTTAATSLSRPRGPRLSAGGSQAGRTPPG